MKNQTDPVEKVRDPVCGMRFRAEKAACTVEYGGRVVHFCTDACRVEFERDPGRYVHNKI